MYLELVIFWDVKCKNGNVLPELPSLGPQNEQILKQTGLVEKIFFFGNPLIKGKHEKTSMVKEVEKIQRDFYGTAGRLKGPIILKSWSALAR